MIAILLDEAREELIEAARYYERQRAGLGGRFLDAVQLAVQEIEEHPRRWPMISRRTRKRFVGRFPYGVLYQLTRREIVIVAIMHLHRKPGYWSDRLRRLK